MNNKITLETFNNYKQKMQDIVQEVEKYLENIEDSNSLPSQQFQTEKMEEYLKLQKELLSFNLSDIPFESWSNMQIVETDEYIPDFSNSHANIDFDILEIYGKGNFKNCNIKNLEQYGRLISEEIFDETTIEKNQELFLGTSFPAEFKEKYYSCEITMDDLTSLNEQQINELSTKNIGSRFKNFMYSPSLVENLSLNNMIKLYKYSKDDFEIVTFFLDSSWINHYYFGSTNYSNLKEQITNAPVSDMKKICSDYVRNGIFGSKYCNINLNNFPPKFIEENDDIFLRNKGLPETIINKYYTRKLSVNDIAENIEIFKDISLENFMEFSYARDCEEKLGHGGLQQLITNHRDAFDYINANDSFYMLYSFIPETGTIEEKLTKAVIEFISEDINNNYMVNSNEIIEHFASFNLNKVYEYHNLEEMKNYDSRTLLLDATQRKILNTFKLEHIIKFDQSTHFFSCQLYSQLTEMKALGYFLNNLASAENINIPDKDDMTYEQFTDIMAECLETMKEHNIFTDYPDYDFIDGEFREKYPQIFIDKNAPYNLKNAFYKNKITGDFLKENKEFIPFLLDKNLTRIIRGNFEIDSYDSKDNQEYHQLQRINFLEFYGNKFGNEQLLNLIASYGNVGVNLKNCSLDISADKEGIDKQYREMIYKHITSDTFVEYKQLINNPEFVSEHKDIFLTQDDLNKIPSLIREQFAKAFYNREIRYEQLKFYPELAEILKEKNLNHIFAKYNKGQTWGNYSTNKTYNPTELELIKTIGIDKFFELCCQYGKYFEDVFAELSIRVQNGKLIDRTSPEYKALNDEELIQRIEEVITKKCYMGQKEYNYLSAPDFLKEKMPNIFLDPSAPQELQSLYYGTNKKTLSFKKIAENKDWLEYLKGKSLIPAFAKKNKGANYIKYFKLFGEEKGLKLGIKKPEVVEMLIEDNRIDLMYQWYNKTGQKFIPDIVIIDNFPIEEADKFLTSAQNWSNLMRNKRYAQYPETRDAMLKLAYSFGAFDQDTIGMKKLQELLTGIPRKYSVFQIEDLMSLEDKIINYYENLANDPTNEATMPLGIMDYENLKLELIKDGMTFNSHRIFSELFHINEDGTATLKINPQSYPNSMKYLRLILEDRDIVLSPSEAHQLFGGFNLTYDKDFREFLLKNIDTIRTQPENRKYISAIQKQFSTIKAFNSNRALTLDLALSFVIANKYSDINVGNDKVAEISAIAGYSQEDFNTLQEIYNYGKLRTFSSIPRIENKYHGYSYETLRLDDPLAMAIGTLTDCCQELNNCAEVCMEHSMVDKNGRVFIIKDQLGNIVAQSWVWRNKDVLCFDNIEIPDKAFDRAIRGQQYKKRDEFTDEVYNIYKQAAKDLIAADEKAYKDLLTEKKITQEQYEGLRLGKVTVGLGYNDIAQSLKNNASIDSGEISRPLDFEEPVKLSRPLYTNDSRTQYILEERQDRTKYSGETLPIHTDNLIEHTDQTFDQKMLLMLERLEIITKNDSLYLENQLLDAKNNEKIVSSIAINYGLNPDTTRIILHPNFAIIYDDNNNRITVGDLLYNFKVDNNHQQMDITNDVLLQIKLAFNQITKNKKIDISNLNEEQKNIYNQLGLLTEEISNRKGVGRAK